MATRRAFVLSCVLAIPSVLAAGSPVRAGESDAKVLIRTAKPYDALASRIESLGGRVTYRYKYVDAIAAEIPRSALASVRGLVAPNAITKDEEIAAPASVDTHRGKGGYSPTGDELDIAADAVQGIAAADLPGIAAANPNAYIVNNALANVSSLHAAGFTGSGVVVAVIDSGIRPGFPHISLDGSVIGCEDFVGDALGCTNAGNNFHGTFVAGMISANVVFSFGAASAIRNAVLAECPGCFLDPPTNTQIPMIGTAPLSSIYALRVFGAAGGAPTSRIIAAVERMIELREAFNAGQPGGQNIKVCNMSLGGSTVFAGRDLFDSLLNFVLAKDIVPVISAGNAGPSSLTVGSPGTSLGAITVGAASLAHNERILRRLQFGPVLGAQYRPFLGTQSAYFSSRGPDADGRGDPDVSANGFASYGQGLGATNSITLASGTSFSAPSVAGVAAVLRQKHPGATARQIRNALVGSANPAPFADGSTSLDRGAGYVNGAGASALLAIGVPDTAAAGGAYNKSVKVNVEKNSVLDVRDGLVVETFTALRPGERADLLYRVHPNTSQVVVALSGVTPSLPPAQQNQLFGDDILIAIHSAKTSAIGEGDYKSFAFSLGGTFVVNDPETGIMRITVNGDWTNAGKIAATVAVFSVTDPVPGLTTQGQIAQSQTLAFPVAVPAGVSQAEFRAGWREDWGNYPTADMDLILVRPDSTLVLDGATLNNPELAVVANPMPGTWLALVDGFEIHTATDRFELRVSLDGKVVQ